MEYSIKPKILGERRIIHYPQKRIIGLYVFLWLKLRRIDGDGVASVSNFVVEWGYDYAGLRANCVEDDLTEQTGYFRAY